MNWQQVKAYDAPPALDTASSKVYNYLTRNVTSKEVEDMDGEMRTEYTYEWAKVKKEDWSTVMQVTSNTESITNTELALTEIYEMILEGGM